LILAPLATVAAVEGLAAERATGIERHGLGEYYTPDWLAAKMVRQAVDEPHGEAAFARARHREGQ
jgi:hypothetical protein